MTNIELAERGFERTEHEHPLETMRKRIEALEAELPAAPTKPLPPMGQIQLFPLGEP